MHRANAQPEARMTVRVFDKDGKLKHEETATAEVSKPETEEK